MKSILRKVLLAVAVILVIAVLAVVWVINDEDLVAGMIEDHVQDLTGRALDIGVLDYDLGTVLRVRAEGVTLENAAWAKSGNLVAVEKLTSSIDLGNIFDRKIVIRSLELDGVSLDLEKSADGEVNWDIAPAGAEQAGKDDDFRVTLEQLQLSNFEIHHASPARSVPLDFVITRFSGVVTAEKQVNISGDGRLGEYDLQVNGEIGPLPALTGGGRVSHQLSLSVGPVSIESKGAVDDIRRGSGADLDFRFSGPQIEWLLGQAAMPEFSSGPFDVTLKLDSEQGQPLVLQLNGDLGTLDAHATGTLDRLVKPSRSDVQFEIAGPDLEALGAALNFAGLPAAPYHLMGDVLFENQSLQFRKLEAEVGEDRISLSGKAGPWPALQGTDLDIAASGKDIRAWGPVMRFERWKANPFSLKARIREQGGTVDVSQFLLSLGDSRLAVDGTPGKLPQFEGASVSLTFSTPDLESLVDLPSAWTYRLQALDVDTSLERTTRGVEVQALNIRERANRLSLQGLIALDQDALARIRESESPAGWWTGFSGSAVKATLDVPDLSVVGAQMDRQGWPAEHLAAEMDLHLTLQGLEVDVFKGLFGDITWTAGGTLVNMKRIHDDGVDFTIAMPGPAVLHAYAPGIDWPDVPVQLNGNLHAAPPVVSLSQLEGSYGDISLQAQMELNLEAESRLQHFRLIANGPEYHQFLADERVAALPQKFSLLAELSGNEDQAYTAILSVEAGEATVEVRGNLDSLGPSRNSNFKVDIDVPQTARFEPFVRRFTDFPIPDDPFSLAFDLARAGDVYEFTGIRSALGRGDLGGTFTYKRGDIPEYRGAFRSELLDLSWFPDFLSPQPAASPDPEEAGETAEASTSDRVFSDEPLPLLALDSMVVKVTLEADVLQLSTLEELTDVRLGLDLDESGLTLDPLDIRDQKDGHLEGAIRLRHDGEKITANIDFSADGIRVGLLAAEDQDPMSYPAWDYFMSVESVGRTPHELAASSNGRIEVFTGKGRVANSRTNLLFTDVLSELVSLLNPFRKQNPYTEVDCTVALIEITDGIAAIHPLVAQSDKLIITSKGTVNLDTEMIDLDFNTRPRKGIGISPGVVINPFIKLAGPMNKPTIALDAAEAALTSGAAIVSGGLTLLGKSLVDRYLREPDPCGKIVAELEQSRQAETTE